MRTINNSGRPDNKNPVKKYSFTVRDGDAAQRLDQAIPVYLKDISREKAKKLIQIGAVWVNKKRVQILSRKVFMGDTVTIYFFQDGWKKSYDINPDNILHEDQWLIFYRKEPGIPTQGLQWDNYNNLYSALFRYLKKKNPMPYAGMHHRLDTDTSGVVLFTVSDKINTSIHNQFKSRLAKKTYLALVSGKPRFHKKKITTYIKGANGKYTCSDKGPGKISTATFTTKDIFNGYSLIKAEPETGRTHQLRLQLAFLGLPVLGDRLYAKDRGGNFSRTMLHAESLTISHPVFKKNITITADLFDDMKKLLNNNPNI